MLKVFEYDNVNGKLTLAVPELLLVREFAALVNPDRNKCSEDPSGKQLRLAYKEFTYIYLALCWQSVYYDYAEQERHQEALRDSGLTEEEFNDPDFRAACRKYRELQNATRSIKMLKAAQNTVDKFVDYFENIDIEERDPQSGKPIFKTKDVMAEISNLHKVHEELLILESQVKKEISESSSVRAGAVEGFMPDI